MTRGALGAVGRRVESAVRRAAAPELTPRVRHPAPAGPRLRQGAAPVADASRRRTVRVAAARATSRPVDGARTRSLGCRVARASGRSLIQRAPCRCAHGASRRPRSSRRRSARAACAAPACAGAATRVSLAHGRRGDPGSTLRRLRGPGGAAPGRAVAPPAAPRELPAPAAARPERGGARRGTVRSSGPRSEARSKSRSRAGAPSGRAPRPRRPRRCEDQAPEHAPARSSPEPLNDPRPGVPRRRARTSGPLRPAIAFRWCRDVSTRAGTAVSTCRRASSPSGGSSES